MLTKFTAWAHRAQAYLLSIAQTWWRPAACWGIVLTIFTNIFLAIKGHQMNDLGQLAALVGSLTPFVAARTWEKMNNGQGGQDDA